MGCFCEEATNPLSASGGKALPAEREQSQTLLLLPCPRRGFRVANSELRSLCKAKAHISAGERLKQWRLHVAEGGARASVPVQGPTAKVSSPTVPQPALHPSLLPPGCCCSLRRRAPHSAFALHQHLSAGRLGPSSLCSESCPPCGLSLQGTSTVSSFQELFHEV